MINPQWLELLMSRTNFHGPKDVRAIEVRLCAFVVSYVTFVLTLQSNAVDSRYLEFQGTL